MPPWLCTEINAENCILEFVYEIRSNKNWLESVPVEWAWNETNVKRDWTKRGNFKRRGDKLHAHVMENLILSRQPENN